MATLVLTAVGTIIGGPIVGLAAGVLGFGASALMGSGGSRSGPRLNDLAVQSSAYGTPLARLYGTIRASGSVIWATDIRETSHRSGGGKGKPKTTTYSYSASFAVALSARPIRSIKRIWGDGKLMRDVNGQWVIPATMRVYRGLGREETDPLIASAEGIDATPAYRGMAYVVFEDLDLSEFANHIPSLSFEIEADHGPVDPAIIIDDLCAEIGFAATPRSERHRLDGFGIAAAGSIRASLEALSTLAPIGLVDAGGAARLSLASETPPLDITAADMGSTAQPQRGERPDRFKVERGAPGAAPGETSIAYYDSSRDYQAGLQRARFGSSSAVERIDFPAALSPGAAKALAERRILELSARRTTAVLHLPYHYLGIRPGDTIRHPESGDLWRVREIAFERWVAELALERIASQPAVASPDADGGRVANQYAEPNGPTVLKAFELPTLTDDLPATPRIWLATTGERPSWRRAEVAFSADQGTGWQSIHTATGASVMGVALNALGPAGSTLWDERHHLDVELLHGRMWLEGRSDSAVLSGANVALLNGELLQFARVEMLGERRFRLSRLLRGRRGTEGGTSGHGEGDSFVMVDTALLGAFEASSSHLGSSLLFRASGPGEDPGAASPISLGITGDALLPPSPVHLEAALRPDGRIDIRWVRRSRQGWTWIDGVDAPIGEEKERYRIRARLGTGAERIAETEAPSFVYQPEMQTADGDPGNAVLRVSVAQLSAVAGYGRPTERTFHLPR